MKGYHWVLVVVLAIGAGCAGTMPRQSEKEVVADTGGHTIESSLEPFSIRDTKLDYVRPEELGIRLSRLEVTVPGGHKLVVHACVYVNGIFDVQSSRAEWRFREATTAYLTAGTYDPNTLGNPTGESVAKYKVFANIEGGGIRSPLLDIWVRGTGRSQIADGISRITPGERTCWYSIATGFGFESHSGRGIVGIYDVNDVPFVCNFFVTLEAMSDDEGATAPTRSFRNMEEPPEGLPLQLKLSEPPR